MKRYLLYTLMAFTSICGLLSCEKSHITPPATSSLTIVNAIPGAASLVPNFNSGNVLQYYAQAQTIAAGSFYEFGGHVGDVPLALSQLTDTTHTVFNNTIHLEPYGINSLYLTGTLTAPDYVFSTDTTSIAADSVVSVRFINLSTNSNPISVDISTNATAPIVSNLPYKRWTKYQRLTFKTTVPITAYSLEFRDVATNKVLYTFKLWATFPVTNPAYVSNAAIEAAMIPARIFKNITLAFKGIPGGTGTNAQGVILINNF